MYWLKKENIQILNSLYVINTFTVEKGMFEATLVFYFRSDQKLKLQYKRGYLCILGDMILFLKYHALKQ